MKTYYATVFHRKGPGTPAAKSYVAVAKDSPYYPKLAVKIPEGYRTLDTYYDMPLTCRVLLPVVYEDTWSKRVKHDVLRTYYFLWSLFQSGNYNFKHEKLTQTNKGSQDARRYPS